MRCSSRLLFSKYLEQHKNRLLIVSHSLQRATGAALIATEPRHEKNSASADFGIVIIWEAFERKRARSRKTRNQTAPSLAKKNYSGQNATGAAYRLKKFILHASFFPTTLYSLTKFPECSVAFPLLKARAAKLFQIAADPFTHRRGVGNRLGRSRTQSRFSLNRRPARLSRAVYNVGGAGEPKPSLGVSSTATNL